MNSIYYNKYLKYKNKYIQLGKGYEATPAAKQPIDFELYMVNGNICTDYNEFIKEIKQKQYNNYIKHKEYIIDIFQECNNHITEFNIAYNNTYRQKIIKDNEINEINIINLNTEINENTIFDLLLQFYNNIPYIKNIINKLTNITNPLLNNIIRKLEYILIKYIQIYTKLNIKILLTDNQLTYKYIDIYEKDITTLLKNKCYTLLYIYIIYIIFI